MPEGWTTEIGGAGLYFPAPPFEPTGRSLTRPGSFYILDSAVGAFRQGQSLPSRADGKQRETKGEAIEDRVGRSNE